MTVQAATANSSANPRARSEENKQFANDASYKSVERQLKGLAAKCHARADSLGLGLERDDVMQMMNESFVRATQTWDPNFGVLFSTYLHRACLNNFNDRVRRPIRDRVEMGMVNMSDMTRTNHEVGDDDIDLMERIDAESEVSYGMPSSAYELFGHEGSASADDAMVAPMNADPAELAEHRDAVTKGIDRLTGAARLVVEQLIKAARDGEELPRFSELASRHQISAAELRRIKVELASTFGVRL